MIILSFSITGRTRADTVYGELALFFDNSFLPLVAKESEIPLCHGGRVLLLTSHDAQDRSMDWVGIVWGID